MLYDRKRWEPKELVVKPAPKPKFKPKTQWQDMLWKAANYIQRHRWIQGTRRDHEGGVCILGALDQLEWHGGFSHLTRHKAEERLLRACPGSIISFNDARGTTKSMVVAKLRSVATGE